MLLNSLSIVDELLSTKFSGHAHDAAVFAAAVIIYERPNPDYYDSFVALIEPGRIRKICGYVESSSSYTEDPIQ